MLWTIETADVIMRATNEMPNGKYIAKDDISNEDRAYLESIDELSVIEDGEHLILNL